MMLHIKKSTQGVINNDLIVLNLTFDLHMASLYCYVMCILTSSSDWGLNINSMTSRTFPIHIVTNQFFRKPEFAFTWEFPYKDAMI